jgi:hypothetical protein
MTEICGIVFILAAAWAASGAEVPHETSAALQAFGLDIPPGPLTPAQGQCVMIADADGVPVVGKLLVTVGETGIVMLPDGQLVTRAADRVEPTEQPFEPVTKTAQAAQLRTSQLAGFQAKETRRYLYLYNCSEPFADAASRILETMFRGVVGYAQMQELPVVPPEVPLVVIIFRTAAEFQRFRRMPEDTVAYYDVISNRVVMYEESQLWRIKPELATAQAIATIAHEGAHQILHNIGVQQRLSLWPMWLNEGLAEFLAPTTTDRQLKWKGVGQANDLRLFELEQWLKNRTAEDADGQLVAQTVGAVRLTSTGYAAAWALTNYLAKHQRAAFHEFVRQTSQLGPLESPGRMVPPGVLPDNVRRFKMSFGEDLADIERCLMLYLKQMPYVDPFADWPHFVAVVSVASGTRPRREANVFHIPEQADRWRREIVEQMPGPQVPTVQSAVHAFPSRLLAEAFARQRLLGAGPPR